MTETEWLEVSDILIRYFPVLKDKDGIVMSLWHKKLKRWFKKDVIKAIEFFAVRDKKPSIAGIIELLQAWKAPLDLEQIEMFKDEDLMMYVLPLRKIYPDKTDDELIDMQNKTNRLTAYFDIIGGRIKYDDAIKEANEQISEIEKFIELLRKEDCLKIVIRAVGVNNLNAIWNNWLIWRVFKIRRKGLPFYYDIRRKNNFHCISEELETLELLRCWQNAKNQTKNLLIKTEENNNIMEWFEKKYKEQQKEFEEELQQEETLPTILDEIQIFENEILPKNEEQPEEKKDEVYIDEDDIPF